MAKKLKVTKEKSNARFIKESEYSGIVQKARNSLRGQNQGISGNDYVDVHSLAHERGSWDEYGARHKSLF